ncbi:MAG: F0F1 ATP synthase subunit B' [Rhodospirillales bacterium]|nr:F0F1 ATP synthase subunit B' [Rhodospirillales bacterium]
MPQFDPSVWSPQFVWLIICFVALYLLMARVALPRVSEVLEEREHKINDNLRKAERLKESAEAAVAAYERTMAEARAKAQDTLKKVRDEIAAQAAERNAQLSERLNAETSAAEARISEAREKAVASIHEVAVDAASAATQRLLGGRIDKKAVIAAVDSAMEKTS